MIQTASERRTVIVITSKMVFVAAALGWLLLPLGWSAHRSISGSSFSYLSRWTAS